MFTQPSQKIPLSRSSERLYKPSHFYGHFLAAVDIETTGLDCNKHEIVQLAVVPLMINLEPIKHGAKWFDLIIRPEHPDPTNKLPATFRKSVTYARNNGMEHWAAVEYFRSWFNKLNLTPGKKLIPVGMNYQFDRGFLIEFFGGKESYDEFFRDDWRDVRQIAMTWNDIAAYNDEPIPFKSTTLKDICEVLGVENLKAHDALHDAITTAAVYKKLILMKSNFQSITLKETAPVPEDTKAVPSGEATT